MAHLARFEHAGTHRLIPTKYSTGSVLETLALPAQVLADLSELDAATNERKLAEDGRNPAIGPSELLYGVPEARIVNAAFCHPAPHGGRFNSAQRGAWYAALELETAFHEVVFHKRRFLKDSRMTGQYTFDYADFLADFSGDFHHLDSLEIETCLRPEPIPQCYSPSQSLANMLLYAGSNGVVYSSVRHSAGTCIACFRPALIFHPRRGQGHRITLQSGTAAFSTDAYNPTLPDSNTH